MKKTSPALEAAEAIGSMVKRGTASTGKSMYKKPKTAGKKEEKKAVNKPVAKTAEKKPVTKKPTAPKPKAAPKAQKTKDVSYSKPAPKSTVKYNYDKNVPAVDLSFDKPLGYTVKDKRIK